MSSKHNRPKWWRLYMIFPLLLTLFAVDNRLKISTGGHQVVQIGTILLIYGLVHMWLKANSSALSKMDRKQYRRTFTVIEIPLYQPVETNKSIQLPDTEIKGVLSDTFEMNSIDMESFAIKDVRKN